MLALSRIVAAYLDDILVQEDEEVEVERNLGECGQEGEQERHESDDAPVGQKASGDQAKR